MPEEILEKVAKTPAIAVDTAIEKSKEISKDIANQAPVKHASNYWRMLGPGLTTGAADDDPSGIATYSQAGAAFGYQFSWLAAFTFPFMSIVQEMCARIGLVTGRGLAANIRTHFPKQVLFFCTFLLFIANTINIGANLGAMAQASNLVFPKLSFELIVIFFAIFSLILQIFTTYEKYARYLKWLAFILLAYVFAAFTIPNLNWTEIAQAAFIPKIQFEREQIILVCAILGTTISPYLFFWQTSQEVEEEILDGKTTLSQRQNADEKAIKKMKVDVWSGMFLSNLVMFFIIITTAATLFQNGITNINSAADAAAALRPIAGERAYSLFAAGIIGTGLLAIPVLAGSASYAISESFKWKFGLYRKLKEASAFYGVIILAMIIGLSLNFLNFDPTKALIYTAVINGLIAPVILILILLISGNKKIMGDHVNSVPYALLGWIITLLMTITSTATIVYLIIQ